MTSPRVLESSLVYWIPSSATRVFGVDLEPSTASPERKRRKYSQSSSPYLRQVILIDRSPLRPQVEAVVFHFEEGDAVCPFRQGLVEDEDGGLDARVWVEDARGQGRRRRPGSLPPASCGVACGRSGSGR